MDALELRARFEQGQLWVMRAPSGGPAGVPDERALGLLPERGAVLFASSGSTGVPKWVVHTRESLRASAEAVVEHLGMQAGQGCVLALPDYHVGGFGMWVRAWCADLGMEVLGGRWQAAAFVRRVAAVGAAWSSLVPTQVVDLVRAQLRAPGCLRGVVVGGGALDGQVERRARELGWPLLLSFGMSEAGSQVATQRPADVAGDEGGDGFECAGLPVLDSWRVSCGQQGALRLAGAALAAGVLRWRDGRWAFEALAGEDGWFETADRVRLQGDRLWPLGRMDDAVKVLGELVSLSALQADLEALLRQGEDGCVRARAALREGSELVLELVGCGEQRRAQLVELFERRTPAFVKVAECMVVEQVRRSALGKVLRG